MEDEETRRNVRKGYARIAKERSSCSCAASCCDSSSANEKASGNPAGYTEDELTSIPQGSEMGLGCGNPVALASLREGETIIDLGSGGGVDCFLAARKVGAKGKIIGIDMTPEMIDVARENARKGNHSNVEFRLGEIENLPVADNTADAIISNCVINLAPNKKRVFEEAFRVLKPGGRLMVSDLVLLKELPKTTKKEANPTSCVTGAMLKDKYIETIRTVGFDNVRLTGEKKYCAAEDLTDDPDATVLAFNPKTNSTEARKVSELDESAKQRLKETLEAIESVTVSATKPQKNLI